jgi:Uma2 family endonuclease
MTLTRLDGSRFELATDWSGYQKILEVVGERSIHVTYDRGRLELLSPGKSHERGKTVLAALLECLMTELEIDFEPGGGMTFKRQDLDRGFEPDECYWITHCADVLGKTDWNPQVDPSPDLAIEVEITSSALNRLGLYHALGVPEVWRLTRTHELLFLRRDDSGYQQNSNSLAFPWLESRALETWLERNEPQPRLVRAFRLQLPTLRDGGK